MFIAANWKAYVEDASKAKRLVALGKKLALNPKNQIVIIPDAIHLGQLAPGNRSKLSFGAQDVSATTGGAQTGELTAQILSDSGVTYALVGHSERRAQGETDHVIALKAQHALAHAITPILCVGEKDRDQNAGYLAVLRKEISSIYQSLSQKERLQVIIAYEPLWAIGKTAAEAITPQDLSEMVLYIRKVLSDFLPGKAPLRTKVLYGGSVEAGNAAGLARESGIDGFLVGHASVDLNSFAALVKAI
jgi:triosephosphate isomerase